MKPISEEARVLIDRIEKAACSCDVMIGWMCEVHGLIRKLVKELES